MRHRKSGLKLNKTTSHRNAMFRNMVTSLFKHERIKTTDAKAKELRRWADHLVTLAKRGDLHARRQALSIVREKDVVHRLFEDAVEKFGGSSGGYTRVVKLGQRPGDAASVSMIELISSEKSEKKSKKKSKKKDKTAKQPDVKASEKEDAVEEKEEVAVEAETKADETDTESVEAEAKEKAEDQPEEPEASTDEPAEEKDSPEEDKPSE